MSPPGTAPPVDAGIAVGNPLAARHQQPAARQQIELIAADLRAQREEEGEGQTDGKDRDDAKVGAALRPVANDPLTRRRRIAARSPC